MKGKGLRVTEGLSRGPNRRKKKVINSTEKKQEMMFV